MSSGNLGNLGNIFGQDDRNIITWIVILLVLIIIFGYGNTSVCGFNFGCFNPTNVSPAEVSPENINRRYCCNPCCNQGYYPGYGGCNSSWIWILVLVFIFFCFCRKHDDCCCDD